MTNAWNKFWMVFVNILSMVDHLASAGKSVAEMADEEAKALAELSVISRVDRVARERARFAAVAAQ